MDGTPNAVLPSNSPQIKRSAILNSLSCLKVANMKPMDPKNDHFEHSICYIQFQRAFKFESIS